MHGDAVKGVFFFSKVLVSMPDMHRQVNIALIDRQADRYYRIGRERQNEQEETPDPLRTLVKHTDFARAHTTH